jgi:hypothetical protein
MKVTGRAACKIPGIQPALVRIPEVWTPIVTRGESAGFSQRRIFSSSPTGSVTQPAVGIPMLICRKIALLARVCGPCCRR